MKQKILIVEATHTKSYYRHRKKTEKKVQSHFSEFLSIFQRSRELALAVW